MSKTAIVKTAIETIESLKQQNINPIDRYTILSFAKDFAYNDMMKYLKKKVK